MSVVELSCPNCDAPIPAQAKGRFSCVYCATTLEVYSSVEAPDVLENGEVALFEIPFEATADGELTTEIYGTIEASERGGTVLDYHDFASKLTEEAQFMKEQNEAIMKRADQHALKLFSGLSKEGFNQPILNLSRQQKWVLLCILLFIMFLFGIMIRRVLAIDSYLAVSAIVLANHPLTSIRTPQTVLPYLPAYLPTYLPTYLAILATTTTTTVQSGNRGELAT